MTALDISSEIICPPTDLWSDEPPLESDLHLQQIILLLTCLDELWRERTDYYASANLTIYYNEEQLKKRDFRGPDFFVVLDTEKRPRKSWVVWGEGGKYPNVIIEILSDSTANTDRTRKKDLYQNTFRTPDYFWFDPNTLEFAGFSLVHGRYEEIIPDERGYRWSRELRLYLGVHEGKLRYFTPEGELVPSPQESALQERLAREQERLAKEEARQRADIVENQLALERERVERLTRKLQELGIDPEAIT